MWVDVHSHVLPGMDDGAENCDISIDMLKALSCQSVDVVALTPHYYSHKETVDDFLLRRSESYKNLSEFLDEKCPKLLLGAEVRLQYQISDYNIKKLCIENTNLILFEFSNSGFNEWMINEIENMVYFESIIPIFAHVERYIGVFDEKVWNKIFSIQDSVAQFSVESLQHKKVRLFAYELIKAGVALILGSDAHNMTTRPPKFDIINKLQYKNKKFNQIIENVKSTQNRLAIK